MQHKLTEVLTALRRTTITILSQTGLGDHSEPDTRHNEPVAKACLNIADFAVFLLSLRSDITRWLFDNGCTAVLQYRRFGAFVRSLRLFGGSFREQPHGRVFHHHGEELSRWQSHVLNNW
jgi:hypothetical protein